MTPKQRIAWSIMTNYNSDERVYLSPERFEELKRLLRELKTKKRLEIAKLLEYAKGLGDLAENAEYQEAKDDQMTNEAEISKLEDLLARASLIAHADSEMVRIGSTVFIQRPGSKKEQYIVVGKEEADPKEGKISNESPLGRAILGRRKSEKILVSTPRGKIEYLIIDIA